MGQTLQFLQTICLSYLKSVKGRFFLMKLTQAKKQPSMKPVSKIHCWWYPNLTLPCFHQAQQSVCKEKARLAAIFGLESLFLCGFLCNALTMVLPASFQWKCFSYKHYKAFSNGHFPLASFLVDRITRQFQVMLKSIQKG